MQLQLKHFIYSVYPYQGHDFTAYNAGIDIELYREMYEPPYIKTNILIDNLYTIYSLQIWKGEIVYSLVTADGKDEFNRKGIYSHNIIINKEEYRNVGCVPIALSEYLIVDLKMNGRIGLLHVDIEDMRGKQALRNLGPISASAIKMILCAILNSSNSNKNGPVIVICKNARTKEMITIASKICQLVPESLGIITFIVAPSLDAINMQFASRYKLFFIEKLPEFHWDSEKIIDIYTEYKSPISHGSRAEIADYLVEKFVSYGYDGIIDTHKKWSRFVDKCQPKQLQIEIFMMLLEIDRGSVSLKDILGMAKKGDKEKSQMYARAMLQQYKWGSPDGLGKLLRLLLEDSSRPVLLQDIELAKRVLHHCSRKERNTIINFYLTENIPNTIKRQLITVDMVMDRKHVKRGPAVTAEKDQHLGPTPIPEKFERKLTVCGTYNTFKSICIELLSYQIQNYSRSCRDDAFRYTIKYVMDIARERCPGQIVYLMLDIVNEFPLYKPDIIKHLRSEDLVDHLFNGVRTPIFRIYRGYPPRKIKLDMLPNANVIVEMLNFLAMKV